MPFCSAAASALRLDLVVVDEPRGLLVGEQLHRLGDRHLAQLARGRRPSAGTCPGSGSSAPPCPGGAMISICCGSTETSISTSLSSSLPSRSILRNFWRVAGVGRLHVVEVDLARRRQQHVEQALLGGVGGAVAHLARLGLARLLDRDLDQVADDRVDVAADVADLGELGRLDLDERRVGEPREPARDLGLADAGRARSSGCSSA